MLMKSDFQEQVLSILSQIPSSFMQKIIVSATVTANLQQQSKPLLSNPIEIDVKDIEQLNSSLHYSFYWCEDNQKKRKLSSCLRDEKIMKLPLLILCQTRLEVVDVFQFLKKVFPTLECEAITVETVFKERKEILQHFQEGKISVLIATSGIVGRGIELIKTRTVNIKKWNE